MDIKQQNISIFKDTLNQISKSAILRKSVENSIENQRFYGEHDIVGSETTYDNDATVTITARSSFDAARAYGGKVCVLNFASATNPGGGVERGSSAQEECLCRCSTLFECLCDQKMMNAFYKPHRDHLGPLHNDDIIYTPDVFVIKSDSYTNLYQPKKLDVITCAAPNLRERPSNAYNTEKSTAVKVSDTELYNIHRKRIHRIMTVANAHGAETLILGAFGCGAFRNNPEVVAKAMFDEVNAYGKTHFVNIEFAIFSRNDTVNIDAFKKVFG